MAIKTPLYGLGTMMHDDFLLVNYADSLQNTEWLGTEYSNLTLGKRDFCLYQFLRPI